MLAGVLISGACASPLARETDESLIREMVTIREWDGHTGFGTPEGLRSYGWGAKDLLVERGPRAVPALVDALRDPELDATQRSLVRLALREMGPRAAPAVPTLVEDLSHADAREAVRILMDLNGIGAGADSAVPELLRLLQERGDEVVGAAVVVGDHVVPESHLRTFVAATLGAIGPRAEAALATLAESASQTSDPRYRQAARTAMRRILGPEPPFAH